MTIKLEERVLLDLGFVKLDSINNEITYYYINNNNDPNGLVIIVFYNNNEEYVSMDKLSKIVNPNLINISNKNGFISLERLCLLISFVNSKNE